MPPPLWRADKPNAPGVWECRLGANARRVRFLVFEGEDGALYYASPRNPDSPRPLSELPDRSLRRWRGPLSADTGAGRARS